MPRSSANRGFPLRLKLLKPHGNYRAGAEIECPWRSVAASLIAVGVAVAVEPAARPAPTPTAHRTFKRKK